MVLLALGLIACQSTPKIVTRVPQPDVLAAFQGMPARQGIAALTQLGFARLSPEALRQAVLGNTLRMVNTLSHYRTDNRVRLRDTKLGGGLDSLGSWAVKGGNLCHSVSDWHEFCVAVFVRGEETLCWPAIGGDPEDTDYLRPCAILSGAAIR